MIACRHLAVIGFAFDDIDTVRQSEPWEGDTAIEHLHSFKEIGAPVLAIECLWGLLVASMGGTH